MSQVLPDIESYYAAVRAAKAARHWREKDARCYKGRRDCTMSHRQAVVFAEEAELMVRAFADAALWSALDPTA